MLNKAGNPRTHAFRSLAENDAQPFGQAGLANSWLRQLPASPLPRTLAFIMRAILSKAILATLIFCGGISTSHASSPLDGTYSRDWWFIEGTSPHQKVVGTDELTIHVIDSSSFKFEVTVTGANAHKCRLSGAANRKGDLFEYHEKLDLSPENYCTLQFQFEKNMVHLNDKFSCKEYCGARAAFVNVTYRAPSLTKKANPPLQGTRRQAARP